jgi:hypothetical protein
MRKSMLFADTIEPVTRNTTEELFLLRIEAIPTPENPESADTGGAYINVWVDTATLSEAEEKAIERIKEEGWQPVKFEHWELVCKDCYSEESQDKEALPDIIECIDTAFEYGVGLLFHTWPIDEAEEE